MKPLDRFRRWLTKPDRLTKQHVPTIPEPDPYAERVSLPGARRRKVSTFPAAFTTITEIPDRPE